MNTFEERGITHLDLHGVKHHDVEQKSLILYINIKISAINYYLW
jgi:hypothetical protein